MTEPSVEAEPTQPHMADAVSPEQPAQAGSVRLVPAQVSAAKLAAELADWDINAELYQRRGWLLLERAAHHVVVGFVAAVPIAGAYTVPVITACVNIDYTNYDLWPPSVTFIDPRTREAASPAVRAPLMEADGLRDALVEGHPDTGRPFLCLPGVREYHQHPQHTGDDWLLHRSTGAGRLAVICERIWQRMVRNVVGLRLTLQALSPALGTQLEVILAQGPPQDTLPIQPPTPSAPEVSTDRTPADDSDEDRPSIGSSPDRGAQ